MAVAVIIILRTNYLNSHFLHIEESDEDGGPHRVVMHLAEVRGMPNDEARGRASDALWLVGLEPGSKARMIGVTNRIEVWSPGAYAAYLNGSAHSVAELAEKHLSRQPVPADDDVIVHCDSELLGCVDYAFGHVHIGP